VEIQSDVGGPLPQNSRSSELPTANSPIAKASPRSPVSRLPDRGTLGSSRVPYPRLRVLPRSLAPLTVAAPSILRIPSAATSPVEEAPEDEAEGLETLSHVTLPHETVDVAEPKRQLRKSRSEVSDDTAASLKSTPSFSRRSLVDPHLHIHGPDHGGGTTQQDLHLHACNNEHPDSLVSKVRGLELAQVDSLKGSRRGDGSESSQPSRRGLCSDEGPKQPSERDLKAKIGAILLRSFLLGPFPRPETRAHGQTLSLSVARSTRDWDGHRHTDTEQTTRTHPHTHRETQTETQQHPSLRLTHPACLPALIARSQSCSCSRLLSLCGPLSSTPLTTTTPHQKTRSSSALKTWGENSEAGVRVCTGCSCTPYVLCSWRACSAVRWPWYPNTPNSIYSARRKRTPCTKYTRCHPYSHPLTRPRSTATQSWRECLSHGVTR